VPRAPRPSRDASEPPLVYVGGDPSLDLVNTVDWEAAGLANERLTRYDRFVEWAEGAGIVPRERARALRRRAAARPREAVSALTAAYRFRLLLQRLFCEAAAGALSPSTCAELDVRLKAGLAYLGLAPLASRTKGVIAVARWRWRDADEHLDSPLWPVAWAAARLLASDESRRVRVCAGPDCGWVYVDRSRNGLRRWCQMATCGTAAKSRRRRQRPHE
jgi:predicted RNA-binding Zn ribbon-like protein